MNVLSPRGSLRAVPIASTALALTLLALLFAASDARENKNIKPFTEGPWGTVFLNTDPEPEAEPVTVTIPEKKKPESIFAKMLPRKKSPSEPAPVPQEKPKSGFRLPWSKPKAGPLADVPPEPAPDRAPKPNSFTGFFKRQPRTSQSEVAAVEEIRFEPRSVSVDDAPATATVTRPPDRLPAQQEKKPKGMFDLFKSDAEPLPEPRTVAGVEPASSEAPKKSGGFSGLFKRDAKPKPDTVANADAEPPSWDASKKSGGFLDLFKRDATPPPKPRTVAGVEPASSEAPKKSGGFSGLFKRDAKPKPDTVANADAEPPSWDTSEKSGGLFGLFKREPVPEAETIAQVETEVVETPGKPSGFFDSLKREPAPKAETVADLEPASAESTEKPAGFFDFMKREPVAKPDAVAVADVAPEPADDFEKSGGIFGLFKRDAKPRPAPDEVPGGATDRKAGLAANTIEREPASSSSSSSAKKARKSSSPPAETAPRFSDKPVSDAAVEAALETQPAPASASRSGGLFGWMRPGTPDQAKRETRTTAAPAAPRIESKRTVDFVDEIKPIFESKCISCHNRDTLHGRVSFESRTLAFRDTPAGSIIVPGSPDSSLMFENIVSSRTTTKSMPPIGHRVSRQEKNLIYTWIKEGAHWPEGTSGRLTSY